MSGAPHIVRPKVPAAMRRFDIPAQLSYALYMPPVLFITLGICLARMRRHLPNPGANTCQNPS